jgi:hypothetical protein
MASRDHIERFRYRFSFTPGFSRVNTGNFIHETVSTVLTHLT